MNKGQATEKNLEGQKLNKRSLSSAFMLDGGQNAALQWLVDTKAPICVFLITGVKFEGVIEAFDQYTISIKDIKNRQQLIYKDKISTLSVKRGASPVNIPLNERQGRDK
ncbi:MAG: RNA chaperone Hfq [Candidatus Anaerobiospirillum merdipullorum]|uniref:RNA chaperone Hfq n=1 Tax=Candidatus Anaerobiospirillum merdipullorum TaxID=2838450 RepID=A0A9E2NRL7_9GAMM|nr:RNA chaperone Hfq [Candidatus Anaerobiospirillum merdipullorum]